MTTEQQKDDLLWKTAKKRAAFKWQIISYLIVNAFLVAIWFYSSFTVGEAHYFWPIWPILGWGVGLAFSYADAYHSNQFFSAEKEYEKLKKGE